MADDLRLIALPTRLIATADATREQTESWIAWLILESDRPREVVVEALETRALRAGVVTRMTRLTGTGLDAVVVRAGLTPMDRDGHPLSSPTAWLLRIRLRCTEPAAVRVNQLQVELSLREGSERRTVSASFSIERVTPRTVLRFPFVGRGLLTQGGVTNGGHRNRSGQFALDVVGVGDTWNIYREGIDESRSDSYAGWGRPIIAPADGRIVRARGDRPDQPDPEKSDPRFYVPEYPNGGDPGNHVVIDHGNGEFSHVAHFQAGSLRVRLGDAVRAGDPIGLLGSSGDTVTPHVHYQLQSGPDIEHSDGLPCAFTNLPGERLVRGAFLHAR